MKVSTYKQKDGFFTVLVEAAVGHGKPPVLISGVTVEDLRERLRPVLTHQRGRRVDSPISPP